MSKISLKNILKRTFKKDSSKKTVKKITKKKRVKVKKVLPKKNIKKGAKKKVAKVKKIKNKKGINKVSQTTEIKNDAGEMVPVHYDSISNAYHNLPADALTSLPNLPLWPADNSSKIYVTYAKTLDQEGNISVEFTSESNANTPFLIVPMPILSEL